MKTPHGEKSRPPALPALLLAWTLAGCASFNDGGSLLPGRSSAAEVEAVMGKPAEVQELAGGQQLWFYPRGRYLRQTHAARLGPDRVLMGVEPRLTKAYIGDIAPGMTAKEVRSRLGPPETITHMRLSQRDVWEYFVSQVFMYDEERLWIQFSGDGVVREVLLRQDPESINVDPGCVMC